MCKADYISLFLLFTSQNCNAKALNANILKPIYIPIFIFEL